MAIFLAMFHDGGPWLLALGNMAALVWGGKKLTEIHVMINSRLDELLKLKDALAASQASEADAAGEKRGFTLGVAQEKGEQK